MLSDHPRCKDSVRFTKALILAAAAGVQIQLADVDHFSFNGTGKPSAVSVDSSAEIQIQTHKDLLCIEEQTRWIAGLNVYLF